MSRTSSYKRRDKVFGEGRSIPLDRNAKARIMTLARALSRRTEPGRHYGILSAKFLAVLNALLWSFHNCQSGRCFPSYESIAEKADCARSTVYEAIHALERTGILTWVNRITRVREWGRDLFGRAQNRWRVIRTSNQYTFLDPQVRARSPDPSKSDLPTDAGGNKPKAGKKKPVTNIEIERLKALLIQVIKRLAKYEPDAIELLDQINPSDPDPDDGLDGL